MPLQTRNGAAAATPSCSLVPPGGFASGCAVRSFGRSRALARSLANAHAFAQPRDPSGFESAANRTNQKRRRNSDAVLFPGAPGRIRTVDTRFRRVFFCENARKFWFYSDALPAVFRHYCHLRSSQTSFLVLLLFYKPSVKQGAERWLTIAKELFARI